MSVNGINGVSAADLYSTYGTSQSKKATDDTAATSKKADTAENGVVYESSGKKERVKNPALVAQLQAEVDNRKAQLESLVSDMLGKQAKSASIGDGIWKLFAKGNYENVDQAAVDQAKEDISENGYWGVKQTSDRIMDFAVALAGDDDKALNKMADAFKKGYKKAEKMWGGELPEICKNTYDTVLSKFDDLLNKSES